ncbi:MAG: hypothetical protein ABI395_02950 [Sphingobium sp.]
MDERGHQNKPNAPMDGDSERREPRRTKLNASLALAGIMLVLVVCPGIKSCFFDSASAPPAEVTSPIALPAPAVTPSTQYPPQLSQQNQLDTLARDIYKQQCLEALTRGNDPQVMQIPEQTREAMCTDTGQQP